MWIKQELVLTIALVLGCVSSFFNTSKMYYIEEGKLEKVEFTNSFVMPANNINVYVEFVKRDYTITNRKLKV